MGHLITTAEQLAEAIVTDPERVAACVVKLPPEVVRWIDQQYTTRQEGLAAIVANAAGVQ
jgi:hypothetical protein